MPCCKLSATRWLEYLASGSSSRSYFRYREKLAKLDLLILDDFGMRKMTSIVAQDLLETREER